MKSEFRVLSTINMVFTNTERAFCIDIIILILFLIK